MISDKVVFDKLQDDLSRKIWGCRMLYKETDNEMWIWEMLKLIPEGQSFIYKLCNTDREKIIFGAGAWGRELAQIFPVGWTCFIDNYKKEESCDGIPIISFEEYLDKHRDAYVVLTARLHYQSMIDQLYSHGIDDSHIINMGKIIDEMSKRQYFDLPALPHNKNEVFVDCGCLDAATSKAFINWSKNDYEMIYAFEPDPRQTELCKKNLSENRAKVFDYGAWNKKDELKFEAFLEGSSYISESGTVSIKVDKLDDLLKEKRVTFIKMDIEGAEICAIEGARELIQKNHPTLAISIYHKSTDISDIPQLLLEYYPDYVFYLRHYSVSASETVLYAIDSNIGQVANDS